MVDSGDVVLKETVGENERFKRVDGSPLIGRTIDQSESGKSYSQGVGTIAIGNPEMPGIAIGIDGESANERRSINGEILADGQLDRGKSDGASVEQ